MGRLAEVLNALGAARERDGFWSVDLAAMQLGSVFGGDLEGRGTFLLQNDAITFRAPPELAACGKLVFKDINDEDALCQSIGVALDELRGHLRQHMQTLRRLGFRAKISAPDPRAHGAIDIDGIEVGVVIDDNGDLVINTVDGNPPAPAQRTSIITPETATPEEAQALAENAARLHSLSPSLSQQERNELAAALGDDDDDDDDSDDGVPVDVSDDDDDERTEAGIAMPSQAGPPRPPAPPPADEGRLEAKRDSLLDEFDDDDDDEVSPRHESVDSNEADGFDDGDGVPAETTSTRPMSGASTAVPKTQHQPLQATRPLMPAVSPAMAMALRNDDAVDDDVDNDIGTPFEPATAPLIAVRKSVTGNVSISDPRRQYGDFDAETAQAPLPNAPVSNQVTAEFDDGKTRALVVDEALLARLKQGDADDSALQPKDTQMVPGIVDAREGDSSNVSDEATGTGRLPSIVISSDSSGEHAPVVDHSAEIATLEARKATLEAELAQVHARLLVLRGGELTGNTNTARSSNLPTEARALPASSMPSQQIAVHMADPPRVGDSLEEEEGDTNMSLPPESLQSIDVESVASASSVSLPPRPEGGSLLDEFDDIDDSDSDEAEPIEEIVAPKAAAAKNHDDDDDNVSLAALQAQLQEMGVEMGETQVAASVMPFQLKNDDGDVFGGGDGGDDSLMSREGNSMSEEATRVRTPRQAASIALVVENDKARDRLRRHLESRFTDLMEADSAHAAMSLRGISQVDAIVFVHPRYDDDVTAALSRLSGLAHRPRVLVLTNDDTFDELPAVDLCLPLGQRASEIAQQVADGLERLGVAMSAA